MVSEELLPEAIDAEESKPIAPTFIKCEVNFVRLPFFALSRKDSSRRIETEYKESAERDGKRIEILWTVTANAKFGYPTPFDKKVHKAIESIVSKKSFPISNPVDFSIYEICKLMNISADSGRNYEMVKNALLRTTFAGIQSKGTFYSKDDKRWIEDAFHLYDRVVFIGETLPNGKTAETNYLFLGDWYLKSLNSFYVKPLDYDFFLNLRSNIGGRLYEFLGLQFYGLGGKPYKIDYRRLCQVLPIIEQKYLSKAIQNLEPAHKELVKKGFLSKVKWNKQPNWTIVYYPGRKAKEEIKIAGSEKQLEFKFSESRREQATEYNIELPQDGADVVGDLIQRGVTRSVAVKLAGSYPLEQLRKHIDIFDRLVENRSSLIQKNPAGFLRKSIEENYQPPEEYRSHRERESKRLKQEKLAQLEQQERDKAKQEKQKIDAYKATLDPEARSKLREKALDEISKTEGIKREFITDILIEHYENEILKLEMD